jgi:hypothetical protein
MKLVAFCLLAMSCGSTEESAPEVKTAQAQPSNPPKRTRPGQPPVATSDPGSCTVRGSGAVTFEQTNVGSRSKINVWHWVTEEQRDNHAAFILNCTGSAANISFMAKQQSVDALPAFGPEKYVFGKGERLTVMGRVENELLTHITGELDVTTFDASRIAGTFQLAGQVKGAPVTVSGRFDYTCPGYSACAR